MLRTVAVPETGRRKEAGGRRWWILGVIGMAQLVVVLDATVVNIALPSAQRALGFDDGDRAWIVTAYALAFGSLLLPGGRITDMIGRRAAFMAGLAGFAVASALGGAATGFPLLVVARALQGCFGALLAPAALALLTTTFAEGKDRARAFGVFGALAGSGSAVGLLLGGALTEYLGWRWTLYINLVFIAAALLGAALLLPRTPGDRTVKLDLPGTALITGGLFTLVYGLTNAEQKGWSATETRVLLGAGIVLPLVFFLWQAACRRPLLPPRVLADRNRAASYLSVAIVGAALFSVFLFLTYYLQLNLRYSPIRTGLAFLPMVAALMAASGLATGVLVPRLGPRAVVPGAMALSSAGMYWLTQLDPSRGYAEGVLPALVVIGLGCGGIMAPAMNLATYGVGPRDAGVAAALVNTSMQVGGSIGTALFNTLAATAAADYLTAHEGPAAREGATLHAYGTVYAWAALLFAGGCVLIALFYPPRRRAAEPEPPPWTLDPWSGLLITEDAYLALPRNVARTVEVVDGRVVYAERTPAAHQRVSWNLTVALRLARPGDSRVDIVQSPDMRFSSVFAPPAGETGQRFTVRRPDVAVLRGVRMERPVGSRDVLAAIEISGPHSLTDFAHKRAEYAFEGIPVYLIVVMDGERVHSVEEYRLDWSGRGYQIAAVHRERLAADLGGGLELDLPFTELELLRT
ncbi:MFS transporter [Actinocorallia longicatena]|uniref:Major facilitator superfamily (MFS) profile domain-containing protein n=1 Tax=Actinocorallia longicatena TaxID=111803 RepID=A0ABP6Q9M3_9ACTN